MELKTNKKEPILAYIAEQNIHINITELITLLEEQALSKPENISSDIDEVIQFFIQNIQPEAMTACNGVDFKNHLLLLYQIRDVFKKMDILRLS